MARNPPKILDELLVMEAQAGSQAAWESLTRRWHPALVRHAYRLSRDREASHDLAQETWIAVVRSLRRLKDPARFRAWLYRILTRKTVDWVRGRQRSRRLQDTLTREAEPTALPPLTPSPEHPALRQALAALDLEHRLVVELFYRDDLSVAEIASALALPPGTVKSRLFHARQKLKKTLED